MLKPSPFDPAPKDPELVRKLLASLWERNLPIMHERIAVLEKALHATRTGTLTAKLRQEAAETAHKLSGSLGMFGFPHGTVHARRIEEHLEAEGPVDEHRLAEDLCALRATILL
jgi:HPt (histidine-containing phosphotransfer) domain-containing protein